MKTSIEVICDTNFWQGWNPVTQKIKTGFILHSNWAVIEELFKSPSFAKNIEHKISAIKKADKHLLYRSYPFEQVWRCLTSRQLGGRSYFFKFGADEIVALVRSDRLRKDGNLRQHLSFIQSRKLAIKAWNDLIAKTISNELYPSIMHKESYRRHDHHKMTRQFIIDSTETHFKISLEKDKLDWNQLQLFTLVMDRYFKDITIKERVPAPNDWYDLYMLTYVQPHHKYFTKESYWKRLIREVGMSHYLIEQDEFLEN